MHCVVVIPFAAPDEAVLLEDLDDFPRDAVFVWVLAVYGLCVAPIIRPADIDIDGDTVAMHGGTRSGVYIAALIGAPSGSEIFRKRLGKCGELCRDRFQLFVHTIDGSDHKLSGAM